MLQVDIISANDYLLEALRLMTLCRSERLQVLEGSQVVGVIYREDIERLPDRILQHADVRDLCRRGML